MQDYLVYSFTLAPMSDVAAEVLIAYLGDVGFDGFQQTATTVEAYIPRSMADDQAVRAVVEAYPLPDVVVSYELRALPQCDWNEQWERDGFQPIEIGTLCLIGKPGHETPRQHDYHILLEPRMAFGSGTHATTRLLTELILRDAFSGQRCLDMGCGTGILAICLSLRGASEVVAIDIDEGCVENTRHNCRLNDVDNVQPICGDASAIEGMFDVIVANIHRNIICQDMPVYASHLAPAGRLIVSGFFSDDSPFVRAVAGDEGLTETFHTVSEGDAPWVVATYERS